MLKHQFCLLRLRPAPFPSNTASENSGDSWDVARPPDEEEDISGLAKVLATAGVDSKIASVMFQRPGMIPVFAMRCALRPSLMEFCQSWYPALTFHSCKELESGRLGLRRSKTRQ